MITYRRDALGIIGYDRVLGRHVRRHMPAVGDGGVQRHLAALRLLAVEHHGFRDVEGGERGDVVSRNIEERSVENQAIVEERELDARLILQRGLGRTNHRLDPGVQAADQQVIVIALRVLTA
jgi:hypothetical protein